jgi:hypothetical protein
LNVRTDAFYWLLWQLLRYLGFTGGYWRRIPSNFLRHKRKVGFLGNIQEMKKSKIEELTKESNHQRNQLFTPQEMRQFFASLPSVINQAGCVVQSVSSVPEMQKNQQNDGSGIMAKKASVIFTGGYNEIIKLFGLLQDSEKKVWIESLRIDTGGAGKLKCQILLTLYCIERVESTLYE